MALTLSGADRAQLPARGNLRPGRRGDVLGLAAEGAGGRVADVGAVQAEADAPAHLGDIRLRQVRIGAGAAALQAGKALVDAPGQQITVKPSGQRMRFEHLFRERHGAFRVAETGRRCPSDITTTAEDQARTTASASAHS